MEDKIRKLLSKSFSAIKVGNIIEAQSYYDKAKTIADKNNIMLETISLEIKKEIDENDVIDFLEKKEQVRLEELYEHSTDMYLRERSKTMTPLIISCPLCVEEDKKRNHRDKQAKIHHWVHTGCGGYMYLRVEMNNLYCTNCGHEANLSKWEYRCEHGHIFGSISKDSIKKQSIREILTIRELLTLNGIKLLT